MNAFTPVDFGELVPGLSGLTATGTGQLDAYILTKKVNVFSSVPSGTGCVLPSSYSPGAQIWILNRDPSNSLLVYPPSGDQIESTGINTPLTVAPNSDFVLVCFDPPLANPPRTWWESAFTQGNLGQFLLLTGGTLSGPGNLTINGTTTMNGGGTISGTFTGNPTFSGNLTMNGTTALHGAVSATALMTFSGLGTGGQAIAAPNNWGQFGWLSAQEGLGGTVWSAGKLPVAGTIPFIASGNVSGTPDPSSNPTQFLFGISSDQTNAIGVTGGFLGFAMNMNFGGGATSGTHHAMRVGINHNGSVAISGSQVFQSALQAWFTDSSVYTGPITAGVFAFNPQVILAAGSQNVGLAEAIEGSISSFATVSALNTRAGVCMISGGSQQGAQDDDGFNLSANPSEVQFLTGLKFGRFGTVWPIDITGSLIATRTQENVTGYKPPQAAWGLMFENTQFTAGVVKSPGLLIDGTGQINVGGGSVNRTSTGISIDVANYIGGSPTISVAGASYQVNDQLTGVGSATMNGGIFIVDTVNGSGNILTGHFLVGREPFSYGGTGPATITMKGGHGNGLAVIGVTWTQVTALSVQPTAGGKLGFNGATPIVKPTGVAVTAAGVHAALTSLGLIAP